MCRADVQHHAVLGQRLNTSQGFSPRTKKGIAVTVCRCSSCGLVYANPQPVPADLQDHYGVPADEYWKPEYFQYEEGYFGNEIAQARKLLKQDDILRALDIGAGLGKCMISLQRAGFDAYGFEPSETFHRAAIEKMGMDATKLRLGSLETMDYEPASFDFITFGAVLEHLYDPAGSIDKALQWLRPGGIVHIEVPSSAHLLAKIINFYYWLRGTNYVTNLSPMHEPFHLYEFGLDSFHAYARRAQCTVAAHSYLVCSLEPFPRFTHPVLHWLMKKNNSGMQLQVWLQKQT
jgi:SAM-dependent methyltransferase